MEMDYPVELVEAFDPRDGQGVVVFVGSGPSCEAGLPSWPDLLRRIAAEVDLDHDVEPHLKKNDLLTVAEFLRKQRTEKDIQERVAKQIKRASREPGFIHQLIVSLPLAGIITTNYDLLLTKADKARYFNTPATPKTTSLRNQLREHFLLHLHGHVDDPETIVLTRHSYDQIVFEGSRVKRFVSGVFQAHVVLFIGFGFADNHIDEILRDFKHDDEIGGSSVFAVIPSPATTTPDKVQAATFQLRYVNPIYVMDRGDHGTGELREWLEGLRTGVNRMILSHRRSVESLRPAYLVEGLRSLLVSDEWHPLVAETVSALANRPDLRNLARIGLTKADIGGLFSRLGLDEMRSILMFLNTKQPHPALRDALSCFPPGTEDAVS